MQVGLLQDPRWEVMPFERLVWVPSSIFGKVVFSAHALSDIAFELREAQLGRKSVVDRLRCPFDF
jgi:hypothetical protein